MEKTIRELQRIAEDSGFYLCPLKVWDTTLNTIWELKERIKELERQTKQSREDFSAENTKKYKNLEDKRNYWMNKYKELKETATTKITSKEVEA